MLIDSHCHPGYLPDELGAPQTLAAHMRSAGVGGLLAVATAPAALAALQQRYGGLPNCWFAAGLHPEAVDRLPAFSAATLADELRAVAKSGVVALGETGLDGADEQDAAQRARQRESFAVHLALAREHDLPVIVHTRGARADTLDVVRAHPGVRGVIHCFTEDLATAKAFIELGFLISFSGIVTFRNAQPLREVAAALPDDALLVETDSPWLAPVPVRGKTNRPAWVAHVAACLAEVRGSSVDAIAATTTANFTRLFGVTPAAPSSIG